MNTTTNSINQNGCSVCEKGQENYVKCVLGAFLGKTYYQYDYRHTDGELFSTLQETLELCRAKRDKWLHEKETKKQSVFMQMHNGTRTGEGSFNVGLQKLFYLADNGNRRKLVKAFPEFFGHEVAEFNITF
jgi:hypothetical protein